MQKVKINWRWRNNSNYVQFLSLYRKYTVIQPGDSNLNKENTAWKIVNVQYLKSREQKWTDWWTMTQKINCLCGQYTNFTPAGTELEHRMYKTQDKQVAALNRPALV
jgi:hypothetical protein